MLYKVVFCSHEVDSPYKNTINTVFQYGHEIDTYTQRQPNSLFPTPSISNVCTKTCLPSSTLPPTRASGPARPARSARALWRSTKAARWSLHGWLSAESTRRSLHRRRATAKLARRRALVFFLAARTAAAAAREVAVVIVAAAEAHHRRLARLYVDLLAGRRRGTLFVHIVRK